MISQWPTAKLDDVQKAVLAKHELDSVAELDACAAAVIETDAELKLYAEGLAAMQHTALNGDIPKMPGVDKIPDSLSKDNTLGVIAALNSAKIERFSEIMENNPPAPDQIPDMLRGVSWDVERETLDNYRARGEFDGHTEFYTALAE